MAYFCLCQRYVLAMWPPFLRACQGTVNRMRMVADKQWGCSICDMTRHDMIWHNITWYDMVWCDVAYFCQSARCISQNLKANNFVFCIKYCFWITDRICLCANIGWRGGWYVEEWQKYVVIWRSEYTFIIALYVFAHNYDMINKLVWTKSIFGA